MTRRQLDHVPDRSVVVSVMIGPIAVSSVPATLDSREQSDAREVSGTNLGAIRVSGVVPRRARRPAAESRRATAPRRIPGLEP